MKRNVLPPVTEGLPAAMSLPTGWSEGSISLNRRKEPSGSVRKNAGFCDVPYFLPSDAAKRIRSRKNTAKSTLYSACRSISFFSSVSSETVNSFDLCVFRDSNSLPQKTA